MSRLQSRIAWGAYWTLVSIHAVGLIIAANGPSIQARYFPVHKDMRVENVARTPDTLCWDYASRKARVAASDDVDMFLSSPALGRMVSSPYGAIDGLPWRTASAPTVGEYRKRWCVPLPEKVPDGDPIRFDLTVYYPGPFGLWRAPLRWPPVEALGIKDASTSQP